MAKEEKVIIVGIITGVILASTIAGAMLSEPPTETNNEVKQSDVNEVSGEVVVEHVEEHGVVCYITEYSHNALSCLPEEEVDGFGQ